MGELLSSTKQPSWIEKNQRCFSHIFFGILKQEKVVGLIYNNENFSSYYCDCITITSPQTYITNSLTVGAECTNLEQIDPASCQKMPKIQITFSNAIFHPATRRRGNVETSQVRLKWNTRRGLDGTSPRHLSSTFPWCLIGKLWRLKRK